MLPSGAELLLPGASKAQFTLGDPKIATSAAAMSP